MKLLGLIIITLFVVFFGCKEDSEDSIEKYDKYVIFLNLDYTFNRINHYCSDTIYSSKIFDYNKNVVSITLIDNHNQILSKESYYLNPNNIADSCIDSTYYLGKLNDVSVFQFKYDINGFKIKSDIKTNVFSGDTLKYKYSSEINYEILNGNIINIGDGYCKDYYSFNEQTNKIDIISFEGDFTGKKSNNLIKTYNSGCHYTPSTNPPYSDFSYNLDSNGFVIKRIENYTSSSYSGSKPQKEKRITMFEYKKI